MDNQIVEDSARLAESYYGLGAKAVGPIVRKFPQHKDDIITAAQTGVYMCLRKSEGRVFDSENQLKGFVCKSAINAAYTVLKHIAKSSMWVSVDLDMIPRNVESFDLSDFICEHHLTDDETDLIVKIAGGYKQRDIAAARGCGESSISKKLTAVRGKIARSL